MTKEETKDLTDLKILVARLDTKIEVMLPMMATKKDFGMMAGAFKEHCRVPHGGLSKKQIGAIVAAAIPVLTALSAFLTSLIVG